MSGALPTAYPASHAERDAWIVNHRPPREQLDPSKPYAFLVEDEHTADGSVAPVATVFLTSKECRFHCVMCDLWRNTVTETVPVGTIPSQIDYALARLTPARQIKLYNSSSFFDRHAIPPEDYAAIAERANRFQRVIVENHPTLVSDACLRFRDLLTVKLEIAMGLETVHPESLARLNKQMTLEQFSKAAAFLGRNQIDLRVFILVQPPFMPAAEALHWAQRSLDFAFECGATAATLIPTRGGNGAMEVLAAQNQFTAPSLGTLEAALEYGLSLHAGRAFADLWDMRAGCSECYPHRKARLQQMNLQQKPMARIDCALCGGLN